MTLCTLLAVFLFGVPFRGSPLRAARHRRPRSSSRRSDRAC